MVCVQSSICYGGVVTLYIMFDYLSGTAIMASIPDFVYYVPVLGEVNFTKIIFATGTFLLLTIFFWFIRKVFLVYLKALSKKTSITVDDALVRAIERIRSWVYIVVALYASLQFFVLPSIIDKITIGAFFFVLVWQVIEIATVFLKYAISRYLQNSTDEDGVVDPNAATASDMLTLIARIAFWSMGILFVLSNLGIEITSLIAGLGIGGVAVAFALQGILSDLFASFSLYFDKPFRVGDFIVIGADSGNVEKIGIKTTRIRTLQGEELVVSNNELTSVRVQNFKKMKERRIVMRFGIVYETPPEQIKVIPEIVKGVFDSITGAYFDRTHFVSFGDSALIFEVVYFVESADFTDYLDAQQAFSFALLEEFASRNITFAYPTQTIYTKAAD